MNRTTALLGLLLAGTANLACAQDLAFETLAKGAMGGPVAPANHLIKTADDLRATGVDRLLPAGTTIDWNNEMVVACLMGTQTSGGYGIEVKSVAVKVHIPAPSPGHPPPLGIPSLEVGVARTVPHGMATAVITSPFHVVRVRGTLSSGLVSFVDASAPARAFDAVRFRHVRSIPGGGANELELGADGALTVSHKVVGPFPGTTLQGRATATELDAVDRAVRGARMGSVPAQLPTPIHIMAGDSFELTVDAQSAALAGTTAGEPGYYEQLDARLRPLVDALEAIITRVQGGGGAPTLTSAVGTVRVTGSRTLVDSTGNRSFELRGPLAATVAKFAGHKVELLGRTVALMPVTPVPGAHLPVITGLEVTSIENPTEGTDLPVQVRPGATVAVFVQGDRVRAPFGPAAEVITRLGPGRALTVDGWVFADAQGRPSELYAERVEGAITKRTALRRSGVTVAILAKGRQVEVLGLSADGSLAQVRAGNRTGWVVVSRVEVGQVPVPLHAPSTGPGISGSVPGQ